MVKSYITKNEHEQRRHLVGMDRECAFFCALWDFLMWRPFSYQTFWSWSGLEQSIIQFEWFWLKPLKTMENTKKTIERGKAFAVNSVPQGVPQRHRYLVCLFVLVVRSHLTVTAGMCPHRKLPKEIPQSLPLGVAWYIWLGNSSNPYRSIWTMRSHLKSQKSNKLGVAV